MTQNVNFSNVCRTCLETNGNMYSIFDEENLTEQQLLVSEFIMTFTSLQIFRDDGLPETICFKCIEEINRAVSFKKLCETSDQMLRNYFCISQLAVNNVKETGETKFIQQEVSKSLICEDVSKSSVSSEITSSLVARNGLKREKYVNEISQNLKPRQKTYTCKECNTNYLGLGEYKRHMVEIHTKRIICSICGEKFKNETTLNQHILKHNLSKNDETTDITKRSRIQLPRTCDTCGKTFRFHSNLERHKLVHTGEKPFLCNVCGKSFTQFSYLKIHSFIHTGEKPYKCKVCEKSFSAPGTLMTHNRIHTGERPHICNICGKDFTQSGYLAVHRRSHTGETAAECKICNRTFNQKGRLAAHMRIHSGEKPYKCAECDRGFSVKGTLKKHIRTHTGERPYICSVCGQAFTQSGTLSTHMKVHQKNNSN